VKAKRKQNFHQILLRVSVLPGEAIPLQFATAIIKV
jgi:hypothetical protein